MVEEARAEKGRRLDAGGEVELGVAGRVTPGDVEEEDLGRIRRRADEGFWWKRKEGRVSE